MSLVGTCHGCGATGSLFDVEATGAKLCGDCVWMMASFPGQIDAPQIRARSAGAMAEHVRTHTAPGFSWCADCRANWRAYV